MVKTILSKLICQKRAREEDGESVMSEAVCHSCSAVLAEQSLRCSSCSLRELRAKLQAEKRIVYYVRAQNVTQGFEEFEDAKTYAVREFENQFFPLSPSDKWQLGKLKNFTEKDLVNDGCFWEHDNYAFTFEKSVIHAKVPKQPTALRVWEAVSSVLKH